MTSKAVRSALAAARAAGIVVVSATGNSSDLRVPGSRYDTLAINVGGTTEHGCLGSYSNHGRGMDVVAPGGGCGRRRWPAIRTAIPRPSPAATSPA